MNHDIEAPVLLCVTGASGSIYALQFIEILAQLHQKTHLVISGAGKQVAALELGEKGCARLLSLAEAAYDVNDFTALPASGSSPWKAMVVMPCSMGTLAAIAHGMSQNLIHRAADCFLKERRPLVLCPRETPLNATHLKNLLSVHEAGAVIYPAMPGFYHLPESIHDLAYFFAGRVAAFLGLEPPGLKRWQGISEKA
ncbi:MAG: UbiX family flavin prenyltransferase [Deltaproteobacteria bacterium]|jgi:4-hydroxy-3-polyprenylbenzoate decarboxylase|nr:UbiX family flavin prenyltransferase [Deltaproteobacteria bacterium]